MTRANVWFDSIQSKCLNQVENNGKCIPCYLAEEVYIEIIGLVTENKCTNTLNAYKNFLIHFHYIPDRSHQEHTIHELRMK